MNADNLSSTTAVPPPASLRKPPFRIRLSPQFVNRLLPRALKSDAPSSQGLLFGLSEETLLVVQVFRSFPEGDGSHKAARSNEDFEQLLLTARKDPDTSPLELVGWYTTRTQGGLLQTDIQFHDQYFQGPNDLAIVLKPEGSGDVLMELYCRSANGVLSGEGHRWGAVRLTAGAPLVGPVEVTMRAKIQDDFFMRAYETADTEPEEQRYAWKNIIPFTTKKALGFFQSEKPITLKEKPPAASPSLLPDNKKHESSSSLIKTAPAAPARQGEKRSGQGLQRISAGAPPAVPAVIPDVPRRYGIPWFSSALVFAVAAGLTFGLVYSRSISSGDGMPGFLKSFFPTLGLGLRLEAQGDRVLLSWNRHHPAVSSAKAGILQIDDGAQHRRVSLDAAQISNGSVLYRPNSDDVTFRLDVQGTRSGQISESIRMLEGGKSNTLDLSLPVPAPADNRRSEQLTTKAGKTQAALPPLPRSTATTVFKGTGEQLTPGTLSAPTTNSQNTQPAPLPYPPADVPVKKSEPLTEVAYDILPSAPVRIPQAEQILPLTNPPLPSAPTQQPAVSPSSPPAANEKQNPLQTQPAIPQATRPAQPATATPTSYRAPRPYRQVLPNIALIPPNVIATVKQIEVLVRVNEAGRVTEAHLANSKRSVNVSLTGAALQAARQWTFEPARIGNKVVASEHSIVFQFQQAK